MIFDYHFRVKANDRTLIRNAFVGIGVLQILGPDLVPVDGTTTTYDPIGPIPDWQNPGQFIKALDGQILHHYNLRTTFDLRQRTIDLAAQGNTWAQQIIANRDQFFSKISNGQEILADMPKRVWL
jgi:hypothetical protein